MSKAGVKMSSLASVAVKGAERNKSEYLKNCSHRFENQGPSAKVGPAESRLGTLRKRHLHFAGGANPHIGMSILKSQETIETCQR
jgi:hypothetical protein